mgnify:CR=1 FL=1
MEGGEGKRKRDERDRGVDRHAVQFPPGRANIYRREQTELKETIQVAQAEVAAAPAEVAAAQIV